MFQEVGQLKEATSDADSPRLWHQSSPEAEGQNSNASLSKKSQGISFMGTFLPSLPSSRSQSELFSNSLSSSRSGISQYFLTEAGKNKTADKAENGSRRVSFADEEPAAAKKETFTFMGVVLPAQGSSNSESSNLTGPTSNSSSTPKPVDTATEFIPWFSEDGKIHPSNLKSRRAESTSPGRPSRGGKSALSAKNFTRLAISQDTSRSTPSHLSANILGPGPCRAVSRSSSRSKQGVDSNTSAAATMLGFMEDRLSLEAATPPLPPKQALPEIPEELRQLIPLDEMKRQTSVGSIQHAAGHCLPCAYWFKGICKFGIHCLHCHFMHEGQKSKRLRPSKQTRIRLRRRAANQAGTTELASDNENEHGEQEGDSSLASITKISL